MCVTSVAQRTLLASLGPTLDQLGGDRLREFFHGICVPTVVRDGFRVGPETFESTLQPGLYLCGEGIDIDGPCGGFSLECAFAAGYEAGRGLGATPPTASAAD